jgi:hypothetical protein
MQQRAISEATLEQLLTYGREIHDHHGAIILCLERCASRTLWPKRSGDAKGKRLNVYAVIGSDGLIKTVGHRYRRIRRD